MVHVPSYQVVHFAECTAVRANTYGRTELTSIFLELDQHNGVGAAAAATATSGKTESNIDDT